MTYANPYELIDRRLSAIEQVLQELRQQNSSQLTPDKIGGMALATKTTGLSEARIYTLVSERKIPHSKRGNRLFFRESELEAWITEGSRKTIGGVEHE